MIRSFLLHLTSLIAFIGIGFLSKLAFGMDHWGWWVLYGVFAHQWALYLERR